MPLTYDGIDALMKQMRVRWHLLIQERECFVFCCSFRTIMAEYAGAVVAAVSTMLFGKRGSRAAKVHLTIWGKTYGIDFSQNLQRQMSSALILGVCVLQKSSNVFCVGWVAAEWDAHHAIGLLSSVPRVGYGLLLPSQYPPHHSLLPSSTRSSSTFPFSFTLSNMNSCCCLLSTRLHVSSLFSEIP